MPPRLRPSNIPSTIAVCPSVCPKSVTQPARASREFSQTSCQQVTLRRRKFYEWLNGPGRALKEPLPGSTNYLGAYDRYGNLIRGGPGARSREEMEKKEQDADKGPESERASGGEDGAAGGLEDVDALEKAVRIEENVKQATKDGKKED